jgi:hypothetical protein
MDDQRPTDRLEALWLDQLYREFTEICHGYRLALRPPLLAISAAAKEYGSWCPETRQLSLSRRLIVGYPWSVTVQVLKHEMAHQLCSEQYRDSGAPHGELFQRACDRLGVLPEFRRAGALLPANLAMVSGGPLSEPGRRCIARVKKLLALAESANEHEAALALQKAKQLIVSHQLSGIDGVADEAYSCAMINHRSKRIARYQRHICSLLGEFFLVRPVLVNLFQPDTGEHCRVIQIFGSKAQVAVAEYCYVFLENRLAVLWEERRRHLDGPARRARNSYYLGILGGFREKLAQQRSCAGAPEPGPEGRTLLVLAGEGLDRYIGLYHPRLCRRRAPAAHVAADLYREGIQAGRKISFAEGITAPSAKTSRPARLPVPVNTVE